MSLTERLGQLFDAFSRRHKVHGPGYKPAAISRELHGRILLLYSDVIAGRLSTRGWGYAEDRSPEFFAQMHQALRLLYGRALLSHERQPRSDADDVMAFTTACTAEELFDFIEAGFKLDVAMHIFSDEDGFVEALNGIFRMDGAPYQVTHGVRRREVATTGWHAGHEVIARVAYPKVVRVDEEVAHSEAVQPALSALSDQAYAGADNEFRRALDDYRVGDFADCLAKCGSAFESVLKVLCQKNRIPHDPLKDTAGPLLDKLLGASTLDAGTFKEPLFLIARMRNRFSSSHGGGSTVRSVDQHVAQYALTATAGAIVLLVQDMGR